MTNDRVDQVRILVNPKITADQLYGFYLRNDICELGYGKEIASRVLSRSDIIVAAFSGDELVGIARALSDGLAAVIMEFCLDLTLQGGVSRHQNGSLIENDEFGVGKRMGTLLIEELMGMGVTFISLYIVEGCEEPFYQSLGFRDNCGHRVYYIDRRPYVTGE